jgi:hypothetical protein
VKFIRYLILAESGNRGPLRKRGSSLCPLNRQLPNAIGIQRSKQEEEFVNIVSAWTVRCALGWLESSIQFRPEADVNEKFIVGSGQIVIQSGQATRWRYASSNATSLTSWFKPGYCHSQAAGRGIRVQPIFEGRNRQLTKRAQDPITIGRW